MSLLASAVFPSRQAHQSFWWMCKAHFKVESAHAVPRQALRHISASERARAGPPAPVAMRTSPSLSRSLILMSLTLRLCSAGYGGAQDRSRRGAVRVASWALWGCPTLAKDGTLDSRRSDAQYPEILFLNGAVQNPSLTRVDKLSTPTGVGWGIKVKFSPSRRSLYRRGSVLWRFLGGDSFL